MALHTTFTDLFGLEHPIALAPMGGTAGGALAAAVSNGGGFGFVGAGHGDPAWMERELAIAADEAEGAWGVGFLSWGTAPESVARSIDFGPKAVMLSFGDPRRLAEPVLEAGVKLVIQVSDLSEAAEALATGADLVVAQGSEAGGHSGRRSTLPFVPAVVDMAGATPVLAAGGIADGRGLAASLALGAAGALIGTRFQASPETLASPEIVAAILAGHGEDTERSRILDIARGAPWPERYPGRTLKNAFLESWRGREEELAADEAAQRAFRDASARGDLAATPVWASEAIDLITELVPAGDLVASIAAEAEEALRRAHALLGAPSGSR